MFVVCCLLLLCVVCGVLFIVCFHGRLTCHVLVLRLNAFVDIVCCSLFVLRCLLLDVCCVLFMVCCLLFEI